MCTSRPTLSFTVWYFENACANMAALVRSSPKPPSLQTSDCKLGAEDPYTQLLSLLCRLPSSDVAEAERGGMQQALLHGRQWA